MKQAINIVFDGPPGKEAGRFVEVELDNGQSVSIGEWIKRYDGHWALRIFGEFNMPDVDDETRDGDLRIIEILTDDGWVNVPFEEVKKGTIYRMFELPGEPVVGEGEFEGMTIFEALEDAHETDGVSGCQSRGLGSLLPRE